MLTHIRKPKESKNDTILLRGANNAIIMMSSILEIIPAVYFSHFKQEGKSASFIDIAEQSYPLISELAQLLLHDFSEDQSLLSSGIDGNHERLLNPDNFSLVLTKNGWALITREKIMPSEARTSDASEPLIGCIARVTFQDKNAIMKLWEWHIKMAPLLYKISVEDKNMKVDVKALFALMESTSLTSIMAMLEQEEDDE